MVGAVSGALGRAERRGRGWRRRLILRQAVDADEVFPSPVRRRSLRPSRLQCRHRLRHHLRQRPGLPSPDNGGLITIATITLTDPYSPRPIHPLAPLAEAGWRLKVYSITYNRSAPRPELEAAARQLALDVLPQPATGDGRYGVGFLGIHDGRGGCFVFVDWWADENELHHHVWISPSHDPAALTDHTATGPAACVWDLAVVWHERTAWVSHVLAAETPNVQEYLVDHLDAIV